MNSRYLAPDKNNLYDCYCIWDINGTHPLNIEVTGYKCEYSLYETGL